MCNIELVFFRAGAKDGLAFAKWTTWPNSLLAHRVQKYAEEFGKADEVWPTSSVNNYCARIGSIVPTKITKVWAKPADNFATASRRDLITNFRRNRRCLLDSALVAAVDTRTHLSVNQGLG